MYRNLSASWAGTLTVATLAGIAGCNSGSDTSPDLSTPADLTVAPDLYQPPDLRGADYPPGPYGNNNGDLPPNYSVMGYWSPTMTSGLASAQPFQEITFDDLRHSGKKYALVQLSAYW